jgi:hypothetical protein
LTDLPVNVFMIKYNLLIMHKIYISFSAVNEGADDNDDFELV